MQEVGFYHPEHGYWQAISEPDDATYAAQPEGTVEVPLKPGAGYEWDGDEWVHNPQEVQQPVPQTVSRFQAKAALMQAGLLDQVEMTIAEAGPLVQLAWAEAVEFRRISPTIATLAAELELTDEAVDDLFRAAMQIEV